MVISKKSFRFPVFKWRPQLPLKHYKRFGLYRPHAYNKRLLAITQHFLAITQINAPLADGLNAMAEREAAREKDSRRFALRFLLLPLAALIPLTAILAYINFITYEEYVPQNAIVVLANITVGFLWAYLAYTIYSKKRNLYSLWSRLAQKAANGASLGDLVEAAPYLFPPEYRAWIHAGERSGNLVACLLRLRDTYEQRVQAHYAHLSAGYFGYMVFGYGASIGIMLFMLMYVFPIFKEMITDYSDESSATHHWFYALFQSNPVIELLILAGPGFMIVLILSTFCSTKLRFTRKLANRSCFRMPYVWRVPVYQNLGLLGHLLGHYLKAGFPLDEALEILSKSRAFSKSYRRSLAQLCKLIRQGESFGDAVALCPNKRLYPAAVSGLIRLGEAAGRLPQALQDIGDYSTQQQQRMMRSLKEFAIPASVILFGSVVLLYQLKAMAMLMIITESILQDM